MSRPDRKDREFLTAGQRVGDVVGLIPLALILGFFAQHERTDTGFFTAEFGTVERICVYGPLLLAFGAPMARLVTGRRNPGRSFEVVTNVSLGLAAIWLLVVFPFDFEHLADPLPEGLEFLLSWVTNGIGHIPLIAQAVIGPVVAVVNLWKYVSVRFA